MEEEFGLFNLDPNKTEQNKWDFLKKEEKDQRMIEFIANQIHPPNEPLNDVRTIPLWILSK